MATETTETTETAVEETPEVKEETTTATSEKEEKTEEEPSIEEKQREEAYNLYKALSNPKTGAPIVKALMQQYGMEIPTTKSEKQEVADDVSAILAKELGEDYEFLAPKLGKAIEKVFDVKLGKIESSNVERDTRMAWDKVNSLTDGDLQNYEAEIGALSDKMLPAPGTDIQEYIQMLYDVASSKAKKSTVTKKVADKIRKNAADAGSRTASSGVDESRVNDGPSKPTLDDAISMAVKKLKLE